MARYKYKSNEALVKMNREGTLQSYANEIWNEWESWCDRNKPSFTPDHKMAVMDISDFLIRLRDDHYSDSEIREDSRLSEYLNEALKVLNQPNDERGRKKLLQ